MSIQSLDRSSSVNSSRMPLSSAQWRWPVAGSSRSRITPSARTRRTAWSTTSPRISLVSRSTVMRAAISRSACSAWARRPSASRDSTELGDQPRRRDRDRRLVRDGHQELRVGLAPRVLPRLKTVTSRPARTILVSTPGLVGGRAEGRHNLGSALSIHGDSGGPRRSGKRAARAPPRLAGACPRRIQRKAPPPVEM